MPFRLAFDLSAVEHFMSMLMVYGTEQVAHFGELSPVFSGIPASRLVSFRY